MREVCVGWVGVCWGGGTVGVGEEEEAMARELLLQPL
jgi:hypothetical protein